VPFITDDTINSYVGLGGGGIGWVPGVCGARQYRAAVVNSFGDTETGMVN
jgi:uncharacterized membrane protein